MIGVKNKLTILALLLALCAGGAGAQTPSVLASGDWWRLSVQNTGIYRLTVADIPELEGADIQRIGIYGRGGDMLSTKNRETTFEDLHNLAIEVHDANGDGRFGSADWILFFGEGTDVWRYSTADLRWEMRRHAYATANCYFLTTSASSPKRIATASSVSPDTTITHHTAVDVVNNDLRNIFKSGQIWFGEKFSVTTPQRNFTLSLPAVATGIKLRYALANHSSATGRFNVSTTGYNRNHSISSHGVYTTVLETLATEAKSFTFTLTYTPGENTGEGLLDYIEITGYVPIAFSASQTMVRNNRHLGSTAAFRYSGGGSALRVWEVTNAGGEREMHLADGQWCDSTREARQYIAFSGSNYLSPTSIKKIANQDLHGAPAADLIVVSHPSFMPQAQRLAALHAIMDGLETMVVTDEQVYNEFSSGKQDPMAIRSFLRSLRHEHPDHAPRYMLLFGKATYDPRNITGHNLPIVTTFETENSFDDDGASYCSDDFMGYLDDNESGGGTGLDVGIGRLPAKSEDEAIHMVDKIESYITRRDLGDDAARGNWRNFVALLADDADPSRPGDTLFAHSSEATARKINAAHPAINVERLYADAYRQQNSAIGSSYPELKNALTRRLNNGCLLLNYIGHGSEQYIGTERYVEPSDITAYANVGRQPLLVTSTCSYGHHDLNDEVSGAEAFMLANGGAIGVISATRPISHRERFNTDVILFALDTANAIGDALRMAKNNNGGVEPCIGLLGDPALHLSVPRNVVKVTDIDGHAVDTAVYDTATVLSQVTVRGEIVNTAGELVSDFDGTLYPIVYDREVKTYTLANDNPGTEVAFMQQSNVLYRGAVPVNAGHFEYSFIVPRDVSYQYAPCKLSHYAVNNYEHATGSYQRLYLGGMNESVEIHETRPQIELYLGDESFRNGGLTDESPTLVARLFDSVGINAFGSGLGHDITATLDHYASGTVVLNNFYDPDIDDPRHGTVRYKLDNLAPGNHTLTLKAWNIWGFSNTATISFRVHSADTVEFVSMTVAPNPATDYALFRYETNSTASITSAVLQIFSAQGGLIATIKPTVATDSYVVGPVRWDLSEVNPGMYLARMLVTTDDGETHQSTAKVIVH